MLERATRFYHADTLPYWRKRKNMGRKPAAVDDDSIRQLADLIGNYFHHRTYGTGRKRSMRYLRQAFRTNLRAAYTSIMIHP